MRMVLLGDVLSEIRNGVNLPQNKDGAGERISRIETISDGKVNLSRVGYGELSDQLKNKFLMKRGDILFSHINSPIHVGKTAIFNDDSDLYHGVNLLLLRSEKILPDYLNYYLKFLFRSGYWLKIAKQAVNQASVNQQDLKKVPIQYPESIEEQGRIVKKLDGSFAAIDKAKQNTEKNLQNAQDLFKSSLFSLISQATDESKELGEIIKLNYGKALPREQRQTNGKFNVYGANGVKDKSDQFLYNGPSIIVGRKGSAGEVNLTNGPFWPLDVTYYVEHDSDQTDLKFIYLLLKTLDLPSLAKGVKPGINRNDVYSIKLKLPSLAAQQQIVKKLDGLSDKTQKLQALYRKKLKALEELRQSILKQAFDGKL